MKYLLLLSVFLFSGFLFCGGCSSPLSQTGASYFLKTKSDAIVFVDPDASPVRKIALMPFKAPTELIGGSVSDLFITEILKANYYTLVERSQISKILKESELAMSGMTTAKAAEVGALVGADGVIIGTVDQYESKAIKGSTYPVVGITLRLIDCKTGKIAWSVDLAKSADDKRATLSTHAREIVHEMMSGLYKELIKYQPPKDPENFKVSDMGLRSASLSWSRPSNRGLTYLIERSASVNGPYAEIANPFASQCSYLDKGLDDAKTYYYRITAKRDNGVKSRTVGPVETFTAPLPDPPVAVTAQSSCVKSVTVSWNKPMNAMYITGYNIMRATSKSGNFVKAGSVSGADSLSYIDGGREPGTLDDDTEYFYKVVTVNKAEAESAPSSVVKAKTRGVPPVVTGVVAKSDCPREVPLEWTPSMDDKVAGYTIMRLNEQSGEFFEIKKLYGKTIANWIDRGGEKHSNKLGHLADSKNYQYKIAAFNIGGSVSPFSKVVEGTTKSLPSSPSNLAAKSGLVKSVVLRWSQNTEKDITSYVVETSTSENGKFKVCNTQKGCEFTHSKLQDGADYFYRIRAIDADTLESEWSNIVSAKTKPCPDPPSELQISNNTEGYMLSWTAPKQQDIASYIIEKKKMIFTSNLGYSNETQFLLTPDQVGKSVSVCVVAIDGDGLASSASEPLLVTASR